MLSKIQDTLILNQKNKKILAKEYRHSFRDDIFKDIFWGYDPFMKSYFFEGNPSFYYEYTNMFDLGRFPIVMLRDGYLGLLDFFLIHPKPLDDVKTIILISKRYESLVPAGWANQVACYEILPRKEVKFEKGKDILCLGHGVEELYWKHSAEDIFSPIEEYRKNFKNTACLFPTRSSKLSEPRKQFSRFHTDLVLSANKFFGKSVVFYEDYLSFKEDNKTKKPGYFYQVDTANVLSSDSYMTHFLFEKGYMDLAFVDKKLPVDDNSLNLNLSVNHKIRITELDVKKTLFAEYFFHYKSTGSRSNSIYQIFQNAAFRELYQKHF